MNKVLIYLYVLLTYHFYGQQSDGDPEAGGELGVLPVHVKVGVVEGEAGQHRVLPGEQHGQGEHQVRRQHQEPGRHQPAGLQHRSASRWPLALASVGPLSVSVALGKYHCENVGLRQQSSHLPGASTPPRLPEESLHSLCVEYCFVSSIP